MPNPPKPTELKKRQGTYRKDRDKSLQTNNIVPFNPVENVPEVPAHLQLAGQTFWNQVWTSGASWINPATDKELVVRTCEMADLATIARNRAIATTDPADMRAAIQTNSEVIKALSLLGFTPADRTRMGVQQVQAESTLEKLMRKKNG
jgi:phage terminase small subunit